MKKQILLLALLLTLSCLLPACGSAEPNTPQQPTAAPVVTTEPTTQPSTEPTAEAPTAPTTEPAVVEIPDAPFYLPVADTIGGASFLEAYIDEDGIINILYENGTQSALEEFLYYCAACGLYSSEGMLSGDIPGYWLYPMGIPYMALAYLEPETGYLVILSENTSNLNLLDQDQLDTYLAYYEQELSFPADYGKNVFPQFFASIGEPQPLGLQGAEVDYVFDGGAFWQEFYWDVSYEEAKKYVDEMILCGFDAWIVTGILDEENALQTTVLQLSNGDADVVLSYDAADGSAIVYYESGTMWTLLSGEDYARYIPQK